MKKYDQGYRKENVKLGIPKVHVQSAVKVVSPQLPVEYRHDSRMSGGENVYIPTNKWT